MSCNPNSEDQMSTPAEAVDAVSARVSTPAEAVDAVSARVSTPAEAVDAVSARSATARVTMTVVLPPDALTVVAAPPDTISQVNVEAVLGIPARTYLELLRRPDCSIQIGRLGKLRIVSRVEFVAWVLTLRSALPADNDAVNDTSEGSRASLSALAQEFDLKNPSPTGRARQERR